jgi:hypothetical protein
MIDNKLLSQAIQFARVASGDPFTGLLFDWRLDGYLQIVGTDRSVLHAVSVNCAPNNTAPFVYLDGDALLLWLATCQAGPIFFTGGIDGFTAMDCALAQSPDLTLPLPFAPGGVEDATPAIVNWQDLVDRLGEPRGFKNPNFVLDLVGTSASFKAFRALEPRPKYVRLNVFGTAEDPAMLSCETEGVALYRALVAPWT